MTSTNQLAATPLTNGSSSADQPDDRTPRGSRRTGDVRRRSLIGLVCFWALLLVVTFVGLTLAWLNQTPWWGWALVGAELGVAGVIIWRWATRRHVLLQLGAWLLVATLVAATAVLAHPAPRTRLAGGEDPAPTAPVHTAQGPVTGVSNDARTVEIFAGIPYAKAPTGALRWRAPQPLEPRTELFVADEFSAVPFQGTSTFFTRALAQIVDVPLVSWKADSFKNLR